MESCKIFEKLEKFKNQNEFSDQFSLFIKASIQIWASDNIPNVSISPLKLWNKVSDQDSTQHLEGEKENQTLTRKLRDFETLINNTISQTTGLPIEWLKKLKISDNQRTNSRFSATKFNILLEKFLKNYEETRYNSETKMFDSNDAIFEFIHIVYERFILDNQKRSGSFYTPNEICKEIVNETLLPYFKDMHNQLANTQIKIKDFEEIIKSLEELRIIDPAIGTGKFIIETIKILHESLQQFENYVNESNYTLLENYLDRWNIRINKKGNGFNIDNGSKLSKKEQILLLILNDLHGFDKDSRAIALSKILIYLTIISELINVNSNCNILEFQKMVIEILNRNFNNEDSLLIKSKNHNKFTFVIGNPPYISSKDMVKDYKKILKRKFSTASGQFDLYSVFTEQALVLNSNNGYCGYIIPDSILDRSNFELIRNLILTKTKIIKIIQLTGVFKQPSVANVILILKKEKPGNHILKYSVYDNSKAFLNKKGKTIEISQKLFQSIPKKRILYLTKDSIEFLEHLKTNTIKLGDISKIHRGEEIGKTSPLIKNIDHIDQNPRNGNRPILFGEDIKHYSVQFNNHYISDGNIKKNGPKSLYQLKKILIRQLGKEINAAIDEVGEYVTLQTIYNLRITDHNYDYFFILGILNSDTIQKFSNIMFKTKKLFPRILLENLNEIPIPNIKLKEQEQIIHSVKKLMDRLINNRSTRNINKEINKMVSELYIKCSNQAK